MTLAVMVMRVAYDSVIACSDLLRKEGGLLSIPGQDINECK